eukprot:Nitzschia sp. Nitz4//scaffold22_size323478//163857//164354//NITZ4_000540-RA/size323478-processed-gene-0.404-mRNA-1//1//CDS//3329543034//5848//frame0
MEVLTDSSDSSPALLSNVAVLKLLEEHVANREEPKHKNRNKPSKYAHRDWIEDTVLAYLQTTPCVNLDSSKLEEMTSQLTSSKRHKTDETSSGEATTAGFGLTKAEALQIANFMPTEMVEIHLMVEELHARMSEQRQEELLEFIASYRTDQEGGDEDENLIKEEE